MKRISTWLILLLLVFSLAGCTGVNSNSSSNPPENSNTQTSDTVSDTEVPSDTTDTPSDNSSASADVGVFDLENGTVLLNNGQTMPILGIGTYQLSQSEAENSVYWALRDGYRLIDTAHIYGNEEGVGRGIKRAISEGLVTRDEIFVTTKMWTSDYDDGENAIEESLRRLDLEYIDLMILHHSQPNNDVTAYQAMEKAVEEGKLHSIGLSNYYMTEDFDRLVNATTITPALLQNETHPYYQSRKMKEHLKQYGTVLESWFPLGGRGNTQRLLTMKRFPPLPPIIIKLLHRLFYAGICRQEILRFQAPAMKHTSRKTMRFLTSHFPMRKCRD